MAQALDGQGKYNEAFEAYRAAQKAEPQASLPIVDGGDAGAAPVYGQVVSEKTATMARCGARPGHACAGPDA
jgi:hypothetical protein